MEKKIIDNQQASKKRVKIRRITLKLAQAIFK